MLLLAVAIGVTAVVLLTSVGEGARRYVTGEFASLGTNLLVVFPGKSDTTGGAAGMMIGETPRDLTVEDAMAIERSPLVSRSPPPSSAAALRPGVSGNGKSRSSARPARCVACNTGTCGPANSSPSLTWT